ncbi:ribosome-recycling factor [Mycobacterium xenopi 4042]|uniref:Ribosome-recycling factor n=1 Tax=Mycobacterium xenopi 4042 TaxID=1299334 RepID=X8E8E8_MYCXE|nr:ribosome-recycling factor [Mycobacterium xenopi 4042]
MIDEVLLDAEERMEKAVSVARDDLATIRTGRANPGMFSKIVIDYYGAPPRSPSWPASTCPRPGWSSSSRTRPTSFTPSKRPSGTPIWA